MPLSDNLYSAEDSDAESFSDELSPSDGYFNSGDASPRGMVQDPTFDDDKKPEDKTLIPTPTASQASTGRSSRMANYPSLPQLTSSSNYASGPSSEGSPSSPNTIRSHISHGTPRADRIFSEHAPLMNDAPPPAYTPNPSSSSGTQARQDGAVYSAFPEYHLERGFLAPQREPQSMGGPVDRPIDEPSETTPLADGNRRRPLRYRRVLRRVLFIAVVFGVIGTMVTAVFHAKRVDYHRPGEDAYPGKNRSVDASGPYCPSATIRNDIVFYDFSTGADLTVIQTTHDNEQSSRTIHVETSGEIRLRRLAKDSPHGSKPHFTVDVHVSHPDLIVSRTWDENSRLLKISTPRYARLDARGPHCVSLEITAWIPEDAEFTNLLIESITLGLRVVDDIRLEVKQQSKFATITGNVWFPSLEETHASMARDIAQSTVLEKAETTDDLRKDLLAMMIEQGMNTPFNSRRIIIETLSGSITGAYALLDYTALSSESGNIAVDVSPQVVDLDAPEPADLEVQTASGSIEVKLPLSHPPPRDYITNVHSTSGSIGGSFYIGSLASFKTTAGSLNFVALPIVQRNISKDSEAPVNYFETHTVAGSTDVEVLNPIFISALPSSPTTPPSTSPSQPSGPGTVPDGDFLTFPFSTAADYALDPKSETKLRTLQSKHSSNSASVSVKYPSAWEGSIHAKTVSGDIKVKGSGLRMVRERKGWAYKEVLARKGVEGKGEGSAADMNCIAGSLDFLVGKVEEVKKR